MKEIDKTKLIGEQVRNILSYKKQETGDFDFYVKIERIEFENDLAIDVTAFFSRSVGHNNLPKTIMTTPVDQKTSDFKEDRNLQPLIGETLLSYKIDCYPPSMLFSSDYELTMGVDDKSFDVYLSSNRPEQIEEQKNSNHMNDIPFNFSDSKE